MPVERDKTIRDNPLVEHKKSGSSSVFPYDLSDDSERVTTPENTHPIDFGCPTKASCRKGDSCRANLLSGRNWVFVC